MAEYDPPKIHSFIKQQKNWKTIDMINIHRTIEINWKLGATWEYVFKTNGGISVRAGSFVTFKLALVSSLTFQSFSSLKG